MSDIPRRDEPRRDPHGPEALPDEQPVPGGPDLGDQPALRAGATSRWLVPAGVLAAVAIVLYAFALRLQVVLPLIGMVYVAVAWTVMFAISRGGGERRIVNHRLAWAMGILALGALLVALGIYLVESTRPA